MGKTKIKKVAFCRQFFGLWLGPKTSLPTPARMISNMQAFHGAAAWLTTNPPQPESTFCNPVAKRFLFLQLTPQQCAGKQA